MRQQLLVERAPVGADTHRLVVADRGLDDGGELPVLLLLEADIPGIDAVLVERFGAGRVIGKELVADIVEIADDRHVDVHAQQPLLDVRHRGRRLVAVDGHAHHFRAGARQRRDLLRRRLHVGGVGIGHRLHDDRCAAADGDLAHVDGDGLMPFGGAGEFHHLVTWSFASAGLSVVPAQAGTHNHRPAVSAMAVIMGFGRQGYSLTAAGLRAPTRWRRAPPPRQRAERAAR